MNWKFENKIYKLGKVYDRILVLQLTRNKQLNENHVWTKKEGFITSKIQD